MKEKFLSTSQAAEYMGISAKTLKEMDYKGILKPEKYTEGGHRRYSVQYLDKYMNKPKKSEKEQIRKKVLEYIALLAKGIGDITLMMADTSNTKAVNDFPSTWKKASILMLELSYEMGTGGFRFPLTLNEQYVLWKTPLNEWNIKYFKEIFESSLYGEDPILYMDEITDFCMEFASLYEREDSAIIEFKKIVDDTRANAEEKEYTEIRRFIIENPIITREQLDRQLYINFSPGARKYSDIIDSLYEDIPSDYLSHGGFYVCPYCGWTLKEYEIPKSGFVSNEKYRYKCTTGKCNIHSAGWNFEYRKSEIRYMRVKHSIQKSVVQPGIVELKLCEKLLKIMDDIYLGDGKSKLELYPNCDFADIKISFQNGEVWMVDVKDWVNSGALASKLNSEGVFKRDDIKFDKGFVVVPNSYGEGYIRTLKSVYVKNGSYTVMSDTQLIKKVKQRLGV